MIAPAAQPGKRDPHRRCTATACTSPAAAGCASRAAAASPPATEPRSSARTCGCATRSASTGMPSRARVSPDGRYGAVTLFVTGHAYADRGTFSTQTTLIDMADRRQDRRPRAVHRVPRQQAGHGRRRQLLGRHLRARQRPLLRHAGHGRQDLPDRGLGQRAPGARDPRERRVPVALARRHADRLQEAHRLGLGALAPDGARPRDDARDADQPTSARSTTRSSGSTTRHVLYGVDGAVWRANADGTGEPQRYVARADSPAAVRWSAPPRAPAS